MTALAVGAGLMAGGGILSALGAGRRRKEMMLQARLGETAYRQLGGEYYNALTPVLQQYMSQRQSTMGVYRASMRESQRLYRQYFEQARGEYEAGMGRALEEMRTGRESTIALTRQTTRSQRARATQANAFTGMGYSTAGQQRVEGIERQGDLQEGMIREQYAAQLSALEAQRAQGLSTLSAQMGQGLAGIEQSLAGGYANMQQAFANNILNFQQQQQQGAFAFYQRGTDFRYQNQAQAAQLAGAAQSAFGGALSSIGGAVFGAGLQGLGTATQTPSGALPNQSASTTGIGTQGGFSNFSWNPAQGQYMGMQGMPIFGGGG